MKHYLILALVIAAVVGAAIFIIRGESEKMRETIRETAAETRKDLLHDAVKEGVEGAVDAVREKIADVGGQRGTPADGSRKTATRAKPEEVVSGLFDVFHSATKAGDELGMQIIGLDTDEENQWGAKLAEAMRAESKLVEDPLALERVERVAAPLIKQRGRSGIRYTFAVLDDPEINACSILGGHVFLNRGLLEFVAGDAELQLVLGHEIAHVELKHCVKRASYAARTTQLASATAGKLVSILHAIVSAGYSEDEEFAADEWGARGMMSIGRSADEILSFVRRFSRYCEDHGLETGPSGESGTVLATVGRELGDHFRTHPPGRERLRRLELVTTSAK